MFKKHVQKKLEKLVVKYFKKHNPKLIVVVGSVGKTTTKNAIATVLSTKFRVQAERNNLNSEVSVPLAIMGIEFPPENLLRSPRVWLRIFRAMRKRIRAQQGVDVIIQELATDAPGQIPHYGSYLRPDMAIVTSVAPEHMENFPGGLDEVAREELSVASYSNLTIVNSDDIDMKFAPYVETKNITNYGLASGEYRFEIIGGAPLDGYNVKFFAPEFVKIDIPEGIDATIHLVGEHNVKAAVAAGLVAAKLGMNTEEIAAGLSQIRPVIGRMNILNGLRGSTIIDDTYNSSPDSAIAALQTLYQIIAEQRIAILGSMNEMGNLSAEAHRQVGEACDPNFLEWVITIGEDAARYLAPAARAKGNNVQSFPDPLSAGAFANKVLKSGGVVLAKGSQNGVFAEEAIKILLAHTDDQWKLVRQSGDWLDKKSQLFQSNNFSELPPK